MTIANIYGGSDPRNIPNYSISDAARYLRIPSGTIRSWTVGRNYQTLNGSCFFKPLIKIRDTKPKLLSFTNLIEVHIVRAIRKNHQIRLDKVRIALDFIENEFKLSHPLASQQFRTDGTDLFIEQYGSLINASQGEQMGLRDAVHAHLERIVTDDSGLAIKLFPFTRSHEENNPRIVVIDPQIAFGRLTIEGTGIAANVLAERYLAGDSIDDLAYDYNCENFKIEEAIRCEVIKAA
jgi:uncharacterized protein (DUF433 family)